MVPHIENKGNSVRLVIGAVLSRTKYI